VGQEQGSNHVDDTEHFCICDHEQVVLSKFVVSLIGWSVAGVAGNDGCKCLEESDALEQEQRHLTHHLARVHGHWIVDDCEFAFNFVHELRADQNFN